MPAALAPRSPKLKSAKRQGDLHRSQPQNTPSRRVRESLDLCEADAFGSHDVTRMRALEFGVQASESRS